MVFLTASARYRECALARASSCLATPKVVRMGVPPALAVGVPDRTTRPQASTPSGSYFSFTRRTRSRLPPQ
jgi:hypothetical protein